MLNELFFENQAGQLEINFDALELVTSKKFVNFVKGDLENKNAVLISVEKTKYKVSVFVRDRFLLTQFVYDYLLKDFYWNTYTTDKLDRLKSMFGDEYNVEA